MLKCIKDVVMHALKCIKDMLYLTFCLHSLVCVQVFINGCLAESFTAPACEGLTCKNGGTVNYKDGMCSCLCPYNSTGLLCDYRLLESAFPEGPYALPMSKEGCAEEVSHGWTTGLINLTSTLPFDKPESHHQSCGTIDKAIFASTNVDVDETYILGPFDRYTLQMNFCFKAANHPLNNEADWPAGNYGIYGTEEGCPSGFTELVLSLCLPPLLHYNIDGSLPGLTVEEYAGYAVFTTSTVINITYCRRRTDADHTENLHVSLKSSYPFLLLKDPEMTSEPCRTLPGYNVSEERHPLPLPTILSNGRSIFQLTYCRYVPDAYGIVKNRKRIKTCGQVEVWVMIDAGSTMQVSGVMWSSTSTTTDFDYVSHILVGSDPWLFVNHGALLCEHHRPDANADVPDLTEVYTCARSVLGRYVTVVFRSRNWEGSNVFSDVMMYILSYDADVAVSNAGCSQEMGMKNMDIQDFQITASSHHSQTLPSSARLHMSGWCADLDDEYPYLQVDVGKVTIINGVKISSWNRITHVNINNTYQEVIEYFGSSSFLIWYGADPEHLMRYSEKEFVYDRSQPTGVPQTYLFQRPFVARYVRLYPNTRSPDERKCLKLELLGCRFGLTNTTTTVLKLDDNWKAIFDVDMREITDTTTTVLLDETGVVSREINYTATDIISDGFPRLHDRNSFFVWNIMISFTYVRLQFAYIKLRTPKKTVSSGFLNSKLCKDSIFISTSEIKNPFVETQNSENYIHLDHLYNNRAPYLVPSRYEDESIYLTFFVCSAHDVDAEGAAFRAHVSNYSYPLCTDRCTEAAMEIITDNFLGKLDYPNGKYYWRIDTRLDDVAAIVKVEDFDISCYSMSDFYINDVKYCNQNLSLEDQYFGLSYLMEEWKSKTSIKVQYDRKNLIPDEINVFPEGFQLTYQLIDFLQETNHLIETVWVSKGRRVNMKACSAKFGKCYHFKHTNTKTWIDVAKTCKEDFLLVNIKTPKELKLLRLILQYFLKTYVYRNKAVNMDVFIGLSRYVDFSGRLKEQWTDGSLLTHTAWDENEPADVDLKECTMMNLRHLEGTNSWFTTSCDQIIERESIYVCEQDTRNEAPSDDFSGNFTDNWFEENIESRTDPAMMFKCSSGEWMSHMVRCNGLTECIDASDETNCTSLLVACDENEFVCTDGQCLHVSRVCDHHVDCTDSSDEYCSFPECSEENEFSCDSRQCIPLEQRCDSYIDCVDGSDEISCPNCNTEMAFQCGDTSCISKRLVCDKMNDCPDGSDERSCDRKYETCDDFLRDGFTADGEYIVEGGNRIKCVRRWGLTEMEVFNYDWMFDGDGKFRIIIPNSIAAAIIQGYACSQKIYRIKHREKRRANMYDGKPYKLEHFLFSNIYEGANDIQLSWSMENNISWADIALIEYVTEQRSEMFTIESSHQNVIIRQEAYKFGVVRHIEVYQMIGRLLLTIKDNFSTFEDRIWIQDTYCMSEVISPNTSACGQGVNGFSQEKQCMYDIDHNGVLDGCRSRNHLQHCDTFVCPWNHYKCRQSYCIPSMYVCNGYIDCPDGEDESVCSCSNTSGANVIGIIVPSSSYIPAARSNVLYEMAFILAASFYTKEKRVYVLRASKGQGQFSMTIDSTKIFSKSEHVTKIYQTHNVDDDDNILQDLFGNLTAVSIGLVWISDEAILNDAEQYLGAKFRNTTANVYKNRVVIDSHIKAEVYFEQASDVFDNAITLRSQDVLSTLGTSLFPDLCTGKPLLCLGHFRCRLSMVCIPAEQVCDGKTNCPFEDDEEYCQFKCPEGCSCGALILDCSKAHINYTIDISPETRVIDASYTIRLGAAILNDKIYHIPMLTKLNVSNCDLEEIDRFFFRNLQNLLTLDISFNRLRKLKLDTFVSLKHLQNLYLTGNKLLNEIEPGAFNGLHIKSLSINHADIKTLSKNTFADLRLDNLDFSGNKLKIIENLAFNALEVRLINIEDNEISEFSDRMFEGVKDLVYLKTSSFKLCCVRPPYLSEDSCYPPKDEFSSCEHLMRNNALKVLLWIFGTLAFTGNILSILYRVVYDRARFKLGYGVFVTNLGISDLLMGFYMLIIAVADKNFEGRYIEFDEGWRRSGWCQFAGVLATLSSEASVLFMVFITIDRLLVIKYPFGEIRFKTRSAVMTAIGCWALALIIAVLPVLYKVYFKTFYGKSAVCLALPLTRDRPPGWLFAILVFIGFNMITFLLIATGQWLIYKEIKKTKKRTNGKREHTARINDLKIARNLLLLVSTDFMCWFPIGLMGFLALNGLDIPGVVYAWSAVLILPINSALNPFLYTFMQIIGKKNLTPNVAEQIIADNKVSSEAMLKLTHMFTCSLTKRGITSSITLADILQGQHLTIDKLGFVIYNAIKYLALLEEHGLALSMINEHQILLQTGKETHVRRKILFIGKPVKCMKKTDQAENMYRFGRFIDRVLSKIPKDK